MLDIFYIALAAEGGHDEHESHGHAAPAHGHSVQPASGHAD